MGTNEQLNGQFRHFLTIISGFLITKGIMTAEDADFWSAVIWLAPGLLVGTIGLVKSWRSKQTDNKTTDLVEQIAEKVLQRIEEKKNIQ